MRNALWLFLIAFFLLAVFVPSYSRLQDLRQKSREYEAEILRQRQRQAQLKEEIRRLQEDPVYLEKVAREKMGLMKEGEIIYQITPAAEELRTGYAGE